jgi:Patatin-like phospholipase
MNMEVKPKPPGALRSALFQDVPYILDSLWRWGEFRANRLGSVQFEEPHGYVLRPAWQSGAFAMFALMCLFAIFGPTSDALCALRGSEFAASIRSIVSFLLLFVALLIFTRVLNAVTFYLMRRAELLATERRGADSRSESPFANLAQAQTGSERRFRSVRVALDRRTQEHIGNLNRFFRALPSLASRDRRTLIIGLIALMCGSLLVVSPLAATAYGFAYGETDAIGCARLDHTSLVVAQFVALLLLFVGGLVLWRSLGIVHAFRTCLALTFLLVLVIGALWLWFTPEHPSEAAGGFYPHVYVLFIGALLAVALFSRLLAHIMFSGFKAAPAFREAITCEDLLHNERIPPDVSNLRLLSALINGVTANPLHFMLLPSYVAFIAPTDWLWWIVPMFALVSVILLMYGSLSSRWEQMLVYVQRWFLVGTPLVMSIAVILLALLRLLGVQYVSTVLDATPVGVLFMFIVMMYVAFWFFEYWVNRWVGEELLEVLGAERPVSPSYVKCAFQPRRGAPWASVAGRIVALHGTGRFVAQGWFERRDPILGERPKDHAFTTYGFVELFDVLGANQEKGEDFAHDIRRRVHLYFTLVNILLVAAAVGLFYWHLNWSRPLAVEPMVRASAILPEQVSDAQLQAQARETGDTLRQRLLEQAALQRPSLVVAASGGGTRAAVYTAVALEGMAQINRARDVVLLSGVSGGGVSAAVFASRFDTLSAANPRNESAQVPGPWRNFVATVSQPFIQDVLEGAGELRIAGSSSLGVLLQESLQRRAFARDMTRIDTFSRLATPGLILNTAISGHPYDDSEMLEGRVAAPGQSCISQSQPYANLAGGRLIFTNLDNLSGFPEPSTDVPDMWLPFRIVNDGNVSLAAASALTANFPPVFSNARVRLITRQNADCNSQSYFVTDGGATENLGLVPALFALRGTLTQLPADKMLSDIHVLAFEASAIDYDYRDDRGVGAATGGSKERINAGLTQTLLKEVGVLVAAHGAELRVHYLPLPVAFRSRGGFGTHWMFARNIRVTNPLLAAAPKWRDSFGPVLKDHVDLQREELMVTWRALFDPREPICARAEGYIKNPESAPPGWTPDVQLVSRWICGHDDRRATPPLRPDYQVEAWGIVVRELGRL